MGGSVDSDGAMSYQCQAAFRASFKLQRSLVWFRLQSPFPQCLSQQSGSSKLYDFSPFCMTRRKQTIYIRTSNCWETIGEEFGITAEFLTCRTSPELWWISC